MKVLAEFEHETDALEAARTLSDEGVDPERIEIRSPYPLPEDAMPPHRERPFLMRNLVRLFWTIGLTAGFSFLSLAQYMWSIQTDWHPIISVPIFTVIIYECAMLTAIWTTTILFFVETRHFRHISPPIEEDMVVANGHIAVIVDGDAVPRARKIFEKHGHGDGEDHAEGKRFHYRAVVTYLLPLLALPLLLTGCALDYNRTNMRLQDAIKPTEASADPQAEGTLRMPVGDEREVLPPLPLGFLSPGEVEANKYKFTTFRDQIDAIQNPVEADTASIKRGEGIYQVNCQMCHGSSLTGDGPVAGNPPGTVFAKPANLVDPTIAGQADGVFYFWITVGKNTMPAFGERLSPREIFDVINYLRSRQGKVG